MKLCAVPVELRKNSPDGSLTVIYVCVPFYTQQEERILQIFEMMPDSMQLLILLYYYDYMQEKEIAELTQWKMEKVSWAIKISWREFCNAMKKDGNMNPFVIKRLIHETLDRAIQNEDLPLGTVEKVRLLIINKEKRDKQ